MAITKGDEYLIPIAIRWGEKYVTPDIVTGVRVQLGKNEFRYPDGKLTYNAGDIWFVPLTQEQSFAMSDGKVPFQVQIKSADNIYTSVVQYVDVQESIFNGVWSDE